jgi:hypothetical protein
MASVVLKDIKTCKKGEVVIRIVSFTDVEVQGYFGNDGHIEEKVRMALRRTGSSPSERISC